MHFGSQVRSHARQGLMPVVGATPKTARYLCDGLSRPNPGMTKLVVHDGSKFDGVTPRPGTNHRAVYTSIVAALGRAAQLNVTHVHLSIISKLVWGQLTFNEGAVSLEPERQKALSLANLFIEVTFYLVEPPFVLPPTEGAPLITMATVRELRRLAP